MIVPGDIVESYSHLGSFFGYDRPSYDCELVKDVWINKDEVFLVISTAYDDGRYESNHPRLWLCTLVSSKMKLAWFPSKWFKEV